MSHVPPMFDFPPMFDPPPMPNLPQEILVEILVRLPVKSLLQFRSASKSLCALIDSPYFINYHLNQSIKKYEILTVKPLISFYSVHLDSDPTAVKLETPFDNVRVFHELLGSCNGLLCLSRGSFNQEFILWNPSTRRYKMMQTIPIWYPLDSKNTYTMDQFGYDHVNDDYKVVRLSQDFKSGSKSNSVDTKVIVYSLKLNSWQWVDQDFPYYIIHRGPCMSCGVPISHGVSICGAIHWIVTQKPIDWITHEPEPVNNFLIVAFDLASQTFRLVPQIEYSDIYVVVELGILGGCLCVMVDNYEIYYNVDVWVMEEYGVKESWRKLVSLTMDDVLTNDFSCVRPIVYLKNGKEVLLELDHEWFVRYHLEKKKFKKTKIRDVNYLSTFLYQESLVLGGSG